MAEYQLSYTANNINQKLKTIDNAVLYTEQTLTDEQKEQARTNIGASNVEYDITVTPEMYGAVGDGVTDDSDAFIAALMSRRRVICDSKKTYYFEKPIDVRTLYTGHLDGNNAWFINFHIYININDTFTDWRRAYSPHKFIIENMNFGHKNDYTILPIGWETPLITTGSPMIIKNIVSRYPYILATVDEYIDYMQIEGWSSIVTASLYAGLNMQLDAISCLDKNGKYCRYIFESNNKSAGDDWVISQCNEFAIPNHKEYKMMNVTNRNPLVVNSCVQCSFDIGTYTKAIFNGCHWEEKSGVTFSSNYLVHVTFMNCYFYDSYVINDYRSTIYQNCYFRTTFDGLSTGRTISNILKNKSFYDLQCAMINCCFGGHSFVNTDDLKRNKYSPKKTYNWMSSVYRPKLNTLTLSVKDNPDKTIGGQFFAKTGNYIYDIYLRATSVLNVAVDYAQYTTQIDDTKKYAEIFITNTSGGFSLVIFRTDPDGNVEKTEYFENPNELDNPTDYLRIVFQDWGSYTVFNTGETSAPLHMPWISIDEVPTIDIEENLYEANGVLVTRGNSVFDNPQNGSIQVVSASNVVELTNMVQSLTEKLNAHITKIKGAIWSSQAEHSINPDTGEIIAGDKYITENLIPVTPGSYAFFDDLGEYAHKSVALYAHDGTFLRITSLSSENPLFIDISDWEDVGYIRLSVGKSVTNPTVNVMEAMTLDYVGEWGSYGCYGFDTTTGVVTFGTNYNAVTIVMIPVEAGATYRHATIGTKKSSYKSVLEYDADGNFIKFTSGGSDTDDTIITLTNKTAFVRLSAAGFPSFNTVGTANAYTINNSFVFEKVE